MAVALLWLLQSSPAAWSQQDDVTFFVIGKHASFDQRQGAAPEPVDYSFFAEIFLTARGDVRDAFLGLPGGERVAFRDLRRAEEADRDNVLLITGAERYASFDALQASYPDGAYRVSFDTAQNRVDATLVFRRRALPKAPTIVLRQRGESPETPEPGVDLEVTWSDFADGGADPNGILDDLVFVILEDASGRRIAHSGRPFGKGRYLTHRDRRFVIDGALLAAASRYTLSVEHAILDDTTDLDGVAAFTTRAVTTRLEFDTASVAD